MKTLVTRDSLQALITRGDAVAVQAIGRALVHLLNRQTRDEQAVNNTRVYNAIGFTPFDAPSGSLTAKYFLKHGTLLDWQVDKWTKLNSKGVARLAKYHRQLNEIANEKAAA